MKMEFASDNIYRKSIRAGNIFSFKKRKTVASRIPCDHHSVPRSRFFFQKINEEPELVPSKMFSPSISIGNGHHISGVRKVVPDFCEMTQKIFGLSCAGDKPDLFSYEHFYRNFSQSEKREAVFFDVN